MTTLRASAATDLTTGVATGSVEPSPLAAARIRRRLTIEEAAARARLPLEEVRSLEESRVWRFPTTADALAATLVYATSLGISEREARRLAGLPVPPRIVDAIWPRRWLALGALTAACTAPAWSTLVADDGARGPAPHPPPASEPVPAPPPLPQRWEIRVDVFNGTKQGNAATGVANEIAGLAYRIGKVANAGRSDYLETRVYYPPRAEAIAERLAAELGVETAALPGGDNPRRLVVIVGEEARAASRG